MDMEYSWPEFNFACTTGGGCVIVEHIAGAVVIRDSKNPQQAGLVFSKKEYADFRRRVRGGSRARALALARVLRAAVQGLVQALTAVFVN